MASESGSTSAPLRETLFGSPGRFEFFQAVRLLKRLAGRPGGVAEEDPDDEIARFRAEISLGFPTADVTEIAPPGEQARATSMTVGFMGVARFGSFGSLPTAYAEEILRCERDKNPALREFLDLFNHRFISLFYRAWEKHRLPIQHETGKARFFERALFALIGLGTSGLRGRLPLTDRALLSRAGMLAIRPIPAECLARVIESYFGLEARVRQFVPGWYEVDPADRSRLGAANSTLGEDLFLGERTRLIQCRFELQLGPLDWSQYQEFFPSSAGFRALDGLVRLATTADLDFDTRLVLRKEEVPPLRLERTPRLACRLGWSTWLHREIRDADAADAVLHHTTPVLAPASDFREEAA